ncbi:MAG TPA: cupin domain-containing protein [Blastocatellia bacterium]|nr:cupin domain-containing protein [Blastocatellia bacterium]
MSELKQHAEFRTAEPKRVTLPNRVTLMDALRLLPSSDGKRFAPVFRNGSLLVEIYAPQNPDTQTSHKQDEVYIVVSGRGWFVNDEQRHEFGPGDFLFVPAGVEHRFEDFTDDIVVWVVFYGPEGGETPR